MPNFDALRTAIIGPLEYLCKPQKPAELLGLWTLQGNMNDLSRYDRPFPNGGTANYASDTFGYITSGVVGTLTLPEISGDRTLDFFIKITSNYSSYAQTFGFGDTVNALGYNDRLRVDINGDSSFVGGIAGTTLSTRYHVAFVRSGNSLRFFLNGVLLKTFTTNNSMGSLYINTESSGSNRILINNVRLVGKALGTSTSFPVPTALYTGYEPL